MPDRDSTLAPRDVGEDFLFHLYRGSELLQENRVHDAKAEIEQALSLQPSDPKGQDLLGIVYFRLGLYPHAIAIYERLVRTHPHAIEPRINLALSYLKTGQPAEARAELEKVVEKNPKHTRAWGYLGLALQRLGEVERATQAFTTGGYDAMARRLVEQSTTPRQPSVMPPQPSVVPPQPSVVLPRKQEGVTLPSTERPPPPTERPGSPSLQPATAEGPPPPTQRGLAPAHRPPALTVGDIGEPRPASEMWSAVDTSLDLKPLPSSPAPPRERAVRDVSRESVPASGPASVRVVSATAPVQAASLLRDHLLVFPRSLPVALHRSGLVLVQAASGFVTRLELIRSMAFPSGVTTTALQRKLRGRPLDEPLGGHASPLWELSGKGELVLAPPVGHKLLPIMPNADALYLREEVVAGFEQRISWEYGRVAAGDGDAISMMLFRGDGSVIASLPDRVCAVEVTEARSATVTAHAVLGWVGRLVPRALLASEAPGAARRLMVFTGEGMVLLDGR